MLFLTLVFIGLASIAYVFCSKCQKSKEKLQILKKCIAKIYLWYLKRKQTRLFQYWGDKNDVYSRGICATELEWFHENPRLLKPDLRAEDKVEFFAVDNDGNALAVHLARKHDRTAEIWIYLKTKAEGEFQSLIHPDSTILNTSEKSFSAGGLTLEALDPLRSWRIVFRGVLRKGIRHSLNDDTNDEVKLCFNFIWRPGYHHYVLGQDFDTNALSDALSKTSWNCQFLKNFQVTQDEKYEQWGKMTGTVNIGDEERKVHLWGTKIRKHGIREVENNGKQVRIHLHAEDGTVLSMQANECYEGIQNVIHGYVNRSDNFDFDSISTTNFNIKTAFRKRQYPQEMEWNLTARDKNYNLKLQVQSQGLTVFQGNSWDSQVDIMPIKGCVNEDTFYGIIEFTQPYFGHCPLPERKSLPVLREIETDKCQKLIVKLSDSECQSSQLVGGKGASLALMKNIRNHTEKFKIPKGMCLTKYAFSKHIKENNDIECNISQLEDITWQKIKGCTKTQCENLVNTIEKSTLARDLKREIEKELQIIHGDKYDKILFAVRSSAIGEDGEEMSAAGQNETYLGVIGLNEIYKSILKCWASQFSFRAIEYKRKNGQLLNAGMGVVIQEMIPSEISGVMFSGDPLTGAFGYVTITANYGLGESVVSAMADPDTVILRRSWDDKLSVIDKQIGEKKLQIVLKDEGGTEEKETTLTDADKCTISNELAIKLGHVAILLENSYGGPRDLEWAVSDGTVYLLQCRPITTYLQETRHEILHEFDTALVMDKGFYTRANVGEVAPGAQSPLSLSGTIRSWGNITDKMTFQQAKYNPLTQQCFGMILYCNSWLMDRVFQKLFSLSEKPDATQKAFSLAIHGRLINDDDVQKVAIKRYPLPTVYQKLKAFYYLFLKNVFTASSIVKQSRKMYENFEVSMDGVDNTKQFYHRITNSLLACGDALQRHVMCTCPTMIWNHVIISILSDGKDYTFDNYTDFANLVGKGIGAISGDVPFSIKELSKIISKEIDHQKFSTMPPEEALEWLKTNNNQSNIKFEEFLQKHGHRGYMEIELSSITWGMEPIKLIKVLQAMLSKPVEDDDNEEVTTIEETIKNLKTPLSSLKKWILSWVLSFVKTAVMNRESAKSLAVRVVYGIRMGYLKLGEMLMKEGRIPEVNLIFYLTHDEIKRLLKTRSARLLNRAFHRQRLHPYMNSLHYPEFNEGDPKAIEEMEEDIAENEMFSSSTKITGCPVSQGIAKGPARVIINFNEVDQIKPGDILVTFATDIGWSPYFPMLGGVVTEIGGLVSHGAVVAREYGLPAIVGARGATKVFKSGDIVYLNASKGTLEKVEE